MPRLIDQKLLSELSIQAQQSVRKRAHYNFHQNADDPVQRMLIAMQPGTYVPVHRHVQPWKWEMLVVLQGQLDCLIFDDIGQVLHRHHLSAGGETSGLELPANCWHSVLCLEQNSVMLELKQGPYDVATAAEMARWSPNEGEQDVEAFKRWMSSAVIGESYL
jgi:cupin fold WbuC family metalloprotein